MTTIKNYLSLVKFSHTIFAMPFALIGFCLGFYKTKLGQYNLNTAIGWDDFVTINGEPLTKKLLIINFSLVLLCMIFARSAAMAFNRYLDRKFDAKNPRTAVREIPAGVISEKNALYFTRSEEHTS